MTDNPYLISKISDNYDKYLRLPIISSIRKQEAWALNVIFQRSLSVEDIILEVGAGNGFYTLDIACHVKTITALEPATEMITQLQARANLRNLSNINYVQSDFFEFDTGQKFDHVIAIGVLDYVSDWKKFLDKCLRLANKSVIVSAPQRGLWSNLYKLGGWIGHTAIHNYSMQDFSEYLKDYEIEFTEAGLKTIFTNGLTMILNIQKERQKGMYEN